MKEWLNLTIVAGFMMLMTIMHKEVVCQTTVGTNNTLNRRTVYAVGVLHINSAQNGSETCNFLGEVILFKSSRLVINATAIKLSSDPTINATIITLIKITFLTKGPDYTYTAFVNISNAKSTLPLTFDGTNTSVINNTDGQKWLQLIPLNDNSSIYIIDYNSQTTVLVGFYNNSMYTFVRGSNSSLKSASGILSDGCPANFKGVDTNTPINVNCNLTLSNTDVSESELESACTADSGFNQATNISLAYKQAVRALTQIIAVDNDLFGQFFTTLSPLTSSVMNITSMLITTPNNVRRTIYAIGDPHIYSYSKGFETCNIEGNANYIQNSKFSLDVLTTRLSSNMAITNVTYITQVKLTFTNGTQVVTLTASTASRPIPFTFDNGQSRINDANGNKWLESSILSYGSSILITDYNSGSTIIVGFFYWHFVFVKTSETMLKSSTGLLLSGCPSGLKDTNIYRQKRQANGNNCAVSIPSGADVSPTNLQSACSTDSALNSKLNIPLMYKTAANTINDMTNADNRAFVSSASSTGPSRYLVPKFLSLFYLVTSVFALFFFKY